MGNFTDLIQGIVVWLLLALIVILILRELWCWYFKLNKIVSILTEIRDALRNQKETMVVSASLLAGSNENNHPVQSQTEKQTSKEPKFFARG